MGQGALAICGLRALSHCVGCSNRTQSADDSNFPWLKVGGQVIGAIVEIPMTSRPSHVNLLVETAMTNIHQKAAEALLE